MNENTCGEIVPLNFLFFLKKREKNLLHIFSLLDVTEKLKILYYLNTWTLDYVTFNLHNFIIKIYLNAYKVKFEKLNILQIKYELYSKRNYWESFSTVFKTIIS